jgi:hypothetical protein
MGNFKKGIGSNNWLSFWVRVLRKFFPKLSRRFELVLYDKGEIAELKKSLEWRGEPWDKTNIHLVPKLRKFIIGDRVEVYVDYAYPPHWRVGTVTGITNRGCKCTKGVLTPVSECSCDTLWSLNSYEVELDDKSGGIYRHGSRLRLLGSRLDNKGHRFLIVCSYFHGSFDYVVGHANSLKSAVRIITNFSKRDTYNKYSYIDTLGGEVMGGS